MKNTKIGLQQVLQQARFVPQTPHTQKVLQRLSICKTAANGYHLYKCNKEDCAVLKYQYHSCRNRHCPSCGALQKKDWIADRQRELLPVPYYHVVFTIPHQLNSIILGNRTVMYNLLFKAASYTLLKFAKNDAYLGAQPGILSVLHTWGQQLSFHPHLHCIVSGGGVAQGANKLYWKQCKGAKRNFLFPVKAMSIVYRSVFLKLLKQLIASNKITLNIAQENTLGATIEKLYEQPWVVYAKKPFGGPQQVINYLAAYTHKVAISNQRIIAYQNGNITFTYKDYADGNKTKTMTLSEAEFLRRFEQHILPQGFTKIRTYGYISNKNRTQRVAAIIADLNLPPHPPKVKVPWYVKLYEYYGIVYNACSCCKQKSLELINTHFGKVYNNSS